MQQTSPVEILPYDPDWVNQFQAEAERIFAVIGQYVKRIEHVGSTAVPGLCAKPLIDILIGVESLADAPRFIPPLKKMGYDYIAVYEDTLPERRYLQKVKEGKHTHHLHIVETQSEFFRTHLLFRDHLRTHAEDAARYASLKVDLAEKHKLDRDAYTDAKAGFIQEILHLAEMSRIHK